MTLSFTAEAHAELLEAHAYFASISSGLARRFVDDFDEAACCILDAPLKWMESFAGARQVKLARFPYFIVYAHGADRTAIVAVAHARKRPGFARGRDKRSIYMRRYAS